MRLRTVLAATFALLALAVAAAGSLLIQQVATSRIRARIGGELAQTAGQVRNLLEANLNERLSDMQVLATVARTEAPSTGARRHWADAMRRVYPVYAWIGFTDLNGRVEASTGGILEGADVSQRPWFRAGLTAPFFGDVHEALLLASKLPPNPNGEPMRFVDVAMPLQAQNGDVVGVVGAHLNWSWAAEVTREALGSLQKRNAGIQLMILSATGEVLVAPPDLIGVDLPAGLAASLRDGGTDGAYQIEEWWDGRSLVAGSSRSASRPDRLSLGWTVLLLQPADGALAASTQLSREIMAAGSVFAIVAALAGWWIAGRIATPLLDLSQAALALPDRSTTLPTPRGYEEVRELTRSFTGLVARLEQRDAALVVAQRDLERRIATRTSDLAKSTAFTSSILETTPDAVHVLRPDGRIAFVNAAAARVPAARDGAGLVDRPFAELWRPEDRREIEAAVAAAAQGEARSMLMRLPTGPGPESWSHLSVTPIRGPDGRPERILALARDVSALKAGEAELRAARDVAELERGRAERASRAKADFLANMSHELRTPLTGMLGVHDLLRGDASLGAEQRQLLGLAHEAGRALLVIVNDVLDFSKIDAGELAIERLPFDMRTLVEGCRRMAAESSAERGIAVVAEVAPDLPAQLLGDPTRVRQVLLNLVTNAVKFTPDGRVTIRAAAEDGRLTVSVTDTGIGIAPETIPALFDRFSQADTSTARRFGGTGLGLAICKRLVEMMGGEIGVESRPGIGSTFWFRLPLEPAFELDGPIAKPAAPAAASSRRVLLAEDNATNRQIITAVLERFGHRVTTANDGDEAVAAFRREPFDIVLMDVQMPGRDGLAATAEIRALEQADGRRPTPIVALTANATAEEAQRCLGAGMDASVFKPVDWAELAATIDRLCGAPAVDRDVVAAASDARILDESILEGLADMLGPDRIRGLLRSFCAETQRRLDLIGPAPSEEDLAKTAHVFVSMAGQLGFGEMSRFCAGLERAERDAPSQQVELLRDIAGRAMRAAEGSRFAAAA